MDNSKQPDKSNLSCKINIEKLDFQKVIHEYKHFTTHLNIVLQNVKDALALGIWCYLSSLPSDWHVNKEHLSNHFNIGRDKLNKALLLLKKFNLIQFSQHKKVDGTFEKCAIKVMAGHDFDRYTEIQYTGTKSPSNKDSHRYTEKPLNGKPVTGKQQLQKKLIQNKERTKKTKSFSDLKAENAKQHEFAKSMNQMANEAKHIEASEKFKRAPVPDDVKKRLGIKKKEMK